MLHRTCSLYSIHELPYARGYQIFIFLVNFWTLKTMAGHLKALTESLVGMITVLVNICMAITHFTCSCFHSSLLFKWSLLSGTQEEKPKCIPVNMGSFILNTSSSSYLKINHVTGLGRLSLTAIVLKYSSIEKVNVVQWLWLVACPWWIWGTVVCRSTLLENHRPITHI